MKLLTFWISEEKRQRFKIASAKLRIPMRTLLAGMADAIITYADNRGHDKKISTVINDIELQIAKENFS